MDDDTIADTVGQALINRLDMRKLTNDGLLPLRDTIFRAYDATDILCHYLDLIAKLGDCELRAHIQYMRMCANTLRRDVIQELWEKGD